MTGSAKMAQQVLATVAASLRQSHPGVPDAVCYELLAEFRAEEVMELASRSTGST